MEMLKSLYDNSLALIVGIDTYRDPLIPRLANAENDARNLAQVLASPPYNFKVRQLLAEEATRNGVLEELGTFRSTQPDDRIIVYFACHGYEEKDLYGRSIGFVLVADSRTGKSYSALRLDEITDIRNYAPAKHILFMFDTCFSGHALGTTRMGMAAPHKYLTKRAYQVLTAGGPDEVVVDTHSMTSDLVRILKTRQLDQYGYLTASSIALELRGRFSDDKRRAQLPLFGHLVNSEGGEFILYAETDLPKRLLSELYSPLINRRMDAVLELARYADNASERISQSAREVLEQLADTDLNPDVKGVARGLLNGSKHSLCEGIADGDLSPLDLRLLLNSHLDLNDWGLDHVMSEILLEAHRQIADDEKIQAPTSIHSISYETEYIPEKDTIRWLRTQRTDSQMTVEVSCVFEGYADYTMGMAGGEDAYGSINWPFSCQVQVIIDCGQGDIESVKFLEVRPLELG